MDIIDIYFMASLTIQKKINIIKVPNSPNMISRRKTIKLLSILSGCLSLGIVPSCGFTWSSKFDSILFAYFEAIIPGVPLTNPELLILFKNPDYGLRRGVGILINDLQKKSSKQFGARFETLSTQQRSQIIECGLSNSKRLIRKLHSAAIYAAQLTFYCGFYQDPEVCDLIEYQSQFQMEETAYPNSEDFLCSSFDE